jgi:NADH:ubiquinone oxidoreductase subunit 3 (subunit A)
VEPSIETHYALAEGEAAPETSNDALVRVHPAHLRYGLLSALFVLQAVLLAPWAVTVGAAPLFVLTEAGIFLVMVSVGLLHALREGSPR